MDFSKIVLLPEELALLKRLAKRSPRMIRPEEGSPATSLSMKWRLIQPEPGGQYSIRKDGKRYLLYCRSQRRELWMKNMWIPIIVSLTTNLVLDVIRSLWPQIQGSLANILARIF